MKDTSILTNNGINVQASLDILGDMEMYDETLGDFLDMSDEKIASLEQYKNANDMPNYAIAVHALKSDARYLGFATLADLSYESEMKSKAGDSVFVAENHPKILQEAKRVINLSQQYMGRELTEVIPSQPASQPVQTPVVEQTPIAQETQQVVEQSVVAPQVLVQPVDATPIQVNTPLQSPQPVQQVVYEQPTQVVQPVMQAVPQTSPITLEGEVPIAQPQMVNSTQNVEPVAAPAQPVQATPEPTIQFFPTDNNEQQYDIMSQALSIQQQSPEQSNVAAVKQGIILVVDDSPLVANFVKKIFSKNYEVIIASDGQKAIDVINDDNVRSKIKTCLLDLNMPNVSGFDVMDYFKEKGFFVRTPVAVISGAEDAETLDKAKGYPIIDILAKPFNERDVQRVVEKCLAVYF